MPFRPTEPTKKEKKVFCVLPGEDAHAHVDAHANAHDDEDDDEDDDDNDADDEALYVITLRASKSSHWQRPLWLIGNMGYFEIFV